MRRTRPFLLVPLALALALPAAARAADATTFAPADKDGFGTARSATPVWYTLRQGC
jgi:hypothetical protein